jgi:GTPase SAR1 family protein
LRRRDIPVEEQPIYFFKIFLIGKKGVGKYTFIKSLYFTGIEDNSELTIGLYFRYYDYSLDSSNKNEFARFLIYIHNPESRFKEMFNYFVLGSNAIFIMFDISDLNSLKEIDSWMGVIRKQCNDIPIMLLGNKADLTEHLERSKVLADSIVKKHRLMGYYEMSALDLKNIGPIFTMIAETLLES